MSAPNLSVAGKAALVTGGAHGLGRMIAETLVRAGAKVIVTSRKADTCEQAAKDMRAHGDCIGIAADLANPEGAVALARAVLATVPALHILINNAGRTWGAPLADFPDKAWASVMTVNVQAPFTLVRELLPALRAAATAADPARIINIGSLAGVVVERLSAYSYAASKAAVHHLTRELAADLAADHITANVVVPGYFPTQMTAHIRSDADMHGELVARIPLARLGTAEDIGGICLFLASPAAAYITGASIPVDGGLSGCR